MDQEIVIENIEEIKEETKKETSKEVLNPIFVNDKGIVQAKDNAELIRYCGAMVSSEMIPDRFNKPGKLFGALMFVRSLNLPDIAIRQVAVIHGVPSLFGDLPLALVQKSGQLESFTEQWFDAKFDIINLLNSHTEIN